MSLGSPASWWSKRSSLRGREKKKQSSTEVAEQKQDKDDLGNPTRGEYVCEAAKEFLKVMEAVAQGIPVPGVGAIVKIALNLIKMCEDSHATLERAEELKLRIKTLVAVLVDELKGKKADEIQEKLKADILSLEKDLLYIQKKLEEILSQSPALVILFKSFNEEKVQKCVERLHTSLERFNLTREINHANLLHRLEKQILQFDASQREQREQLESIQFGIDEIKLLLGDRPDGSSTSQSHSRATMPAPTSLFYGRDHVVADLVANLTNVTEGKKSPRICLLGPGGMGKTSTALAAMAHPDTKKCFPDTNQAWVPCVMATSIPLFLDTLSQSLGITKTSVNPRSDILNELKSSPPLVLLLDNFETPWNIDGGRADTERILRNIEQLPHITLFLTMRSSAPPCKGIRWHAVDLKAVDAEAARQIYSEIYPAGGTDPQLPQLLQLVGYLPLAITLIASFGHFTSLGAEDLMKQYNVTGTAMLGQGSDAENSMDICISLSVDSPPMKRHPEAFELLAILAMLPVGTTANMLITWWAREVRNVAGALQVLGETSLVERQDTTFVVLPVIQRYVLDAARFPSHVRTSMVESACDFLGKHKSSPGDASYKEDTKAIAIEESNLQEILMGATTPTPPLIDALLVLARHQRHTRPRTDVIEHAFKLVRQLKDRPDIVGRTMECYGLIFSTFIRDNEALEQFTLAREVYLSIPDTSKAAMCLLHQLEVHNHSTHPVVAENKALIEKAQAEFEAARDTHGTALCLYHLGTLAWQNATSWPSPAEEVAHAADLLDRARAMFDGPLHIANCSSELAKNYYWAAQYEEAQTQAVSAAQQYQEIGFYDTDPSIMHARSCLARRDYDGGLFVVIPMLETAKSYGVSLTIAMILELIGLFWACMGKKADARGAFEESLHYSSTVSDAGVTHRARFFLRKLLDPGTIPDSEEERYIEIIYPFDIVGML
ncbi:hypothetical protein FPV67DRAFT_1574370 [Lyophyllum atratum]|nr:hypothetical protein FPV67DRAFT_1574370 [Lyophyllum atratum]